MPGLPVSEHQLLVTLTEKLLVANQSVELWLFGSRARETHRPFSDIDVLLVSTGSHKFSSKQIQTLQFELEDSQSPYKFDIVNDSSLLNEYREKINLEKKLMGRIYPKS